MFQEILLIRIKSIFIVHKDLLGRLIKDTLGYKLADPKLEMTDIPNKRPYEKLKQCDFLITNGNYIINIELK